MKQLVIVGAGGHGKVVAECAVQNGYEKIVFLDDDKGLKACGRYPVIGTKKDLGSFTEAGDAAVNFFVAIGNPLIRQQIQEEIGKRGGTLATLIHPDAVISSDAEVGVGTVVMAGTVINTGAAIGSGCIVNTASSIDHDCHIGNFVHVAVGAHIAGGVNVGERTWIGAGATVSNHVNICDDCMIGAGAVVVKDIDVPGTYIGIPAKRMREKGRKG